VLPPAPQELAVAVRLGREAGAFIEGVRREGFERLEKEDRSAVTRADLGADAIIRAGLRATFPRDGVLTEESARHVGASGRAWVVDPLDGTNAFVDGAARGYAVQIGLVVGGVVTLGVVYECRLDRLFFAVRGEGAWLVEGAAPARRLRVSGRRSFDAMPLITSSSISEPGRARLLALGFVDGGSMRSVGVKVGELVTEAADVYFSHHRLSVWDTCAPSVILEEAGGRMTTLEGEALSFGLADDAPESPGPVIATNGLRHDDVTAAVRAAWEV